MGVEDTAIIIAVIGFSLFLLTILWQRKYFALVWMRQKNRSIGHHVKIWHKDGTYTEYLVPNVKSFDWKKKPWAKLFSNLPDWIDTVKIPNTPYARDRRTGFASYEFNEDSKECIDPRERQPDLFMYQVDQNDLENAFELGRKWERMKDGSSFNRIVMILLVLNLVVSTIGTVFVNEMATSIQEFRDNVKPLIDRANQFIADYDAGTLALPTGSSIPPGQSGQVG